MNMFSTLRLKLIALFSLIVGIIALFVFFYFPARLKEASLKSVEEKANTIATMAAYSLGPALYFNDEDNLNEAILAARQNRDLVYYRIEDSNRVVVSTFYEQRNTGVIDSLAIFFNRAEIEFNGRFLGTIHIGLSLESVSETVQNSQITIAVVSALIFLLGVIAIFVISTLLTRPLHRIVDTFEHIAAGNFSRRAEISSSDEIGQLSAAFNTMVDKVERAQQELFGSNIELEMRVEERTRALRESEERYRLMVEHSPDAIGVHSEGKLVYVNPSAVKLFKAKSDSELLGRSVIDLVHPDYRAAVIARLKTMTEEKEIVPVIGEKLLCVDGSVIEAEVSALPFVYNGKPSIQVIVRDISERNRIERQRQQLEQQLLSAQKMESIGTLAGGIAHDFNNILAIVGGYAEMIARYGKEKDEKIVQRAEAIQKISDRGAGLVRQLLTFAKKTETNIDTIEVNTMVNELLDMLSQTFPKYITIETRFEEHLQLISADQNQMYQALLNLCVNARDAIVARNEQQPGPNVLTIATGAVRGAALKENYPSALDIPYVRIDISDTGAGMNEETQKRIFEPFFSTKDIGKGTGLGLSVVYGVVNSHHGFVNVQSKEGAGTTFSVFLPAAEEGREDAGPTRARSDARLHGNETILLVEDEEMLLDINKSIFTSLGYSVLCTRDGEEALALYTDQRSSIDLVISDMGLPKLDGWHLYQQLKAINRNIKFIITSGFLDNPMRDQMHRSGIYAIVNKPYKTGDLIDVVREAFDS